MLTGQKLARGPSRAYGLRGDVGKKIALLMQALRRPSRCRYVPLRLPLYYAPPTPRRPAEEAERALEEACLDRFGTLRPTGATPTFRSDNGLIYQSWRFRAALSRLPARAGVHHPIHAGAERDHRALLPQREGGNASDSTTSSLRARPERVERVDPMVARGVPAPDVGAIGARVRSGRKKPLRWRDSRGTLHSPHRLTKRGGQE